MLGLTACAQSVFEPLTPEEPDDATEQSASTAEPPATVTTPSGAQRPVSTPPRTPEPELVQPTPILPVGEVPQELLDKMVDALVAQLGVSRQDIMVVAAESVVWNDGSLGCPKPGEFYTQALVPGYRVILEVDGVQYNYHASEKGYFFLCGSLGGGRGLPSDRLTPDR